MGNDMRLVKFGMMISDIFDDLGRQGLYMSMPLEVYGGYETSWLSIMYDYDKLNEYGKAIVDQVSDSSEFICEDGSRRDMDMNKQMEAAKAILKILKDGESKISFLGISRSEVYWKDIKLHLLFWALMVLAVDDTDKEEHLSMICAYAKTLSVSDDEMMDLVRIIRVLYNVEGDNQIQTDRVAIEFSEVIEKYGIEVIEKYEIEEAQEQ